jgi:hypothetical protein
MGDAGLPKTGKAACVSNPGPDFTVVVKDDVAVPQPGKIQTS